MEEKNSRKEHISFSQVQENLFTGQKGGWKGEGKAKENKTKQKPKISQAGKQHTKNTFRRCIHGIFDSHSEMALYTHAAIPQTIQWNRFEIEGGTVLHCCPRTAKSRC